MWLILEECGVFCALFTYFIVVFVYWAFVRVGIWEEVKNGEISAFFHFAVF
jgi:hypothetical protein